MRPRNNCKGICCVIRRWGAKADPTLANLKWNIMTRLPRGFLHCKHLPQVSHSQAGTSPGLPQYSPTQPDQVCAFFRAECYITSLTTCGTLIQCFITDSDWRPHHSLVRLEVVSLTAEHSGGCVLWVAGNGCALLTHTHS